MSYNGDFNAEFGDELCAEFSDAFITDFYQACDMLCESFDHSVGLISQMIYHSKFSMNEAEYFFNSIVPLPNGENSARILLDLTKKIVDLPQFDVSVVIPRLRQSLIFTLVHGRYSIYNDYKDYVKIICSHSSIFSTDFEEFYVDFMDNMDIAGYHDKYMIFDSLLYRYKCIGNPEFMNDLIVSLMKIYLKKTPSFNKHLVELSLFKRTMTLPSHMKADFFPETMKNELIMCV